MSRPHVAALVEDTWHRQLERGLRRRGWENRIIGHVGYGSPSFIRVFGRVLLGRARDEGGDSDEPDPTYGGMRSPFLRDRGWRAFVTAPAMGVPVSVRVDGRTFHARSERSGHIDATFRDHGLEPGWHRVTISAQGAKDIEAEVVVVGVGVAPVTGWLEGSGLTIDNGVVCDDRCRAIGGGGAIVAAGDVARWDHPRFGTMRIEHWTNAVEQAGAAAAALLKGDDAPPFDPVPYFWSDQYDTKIQYVGHAAGDDPVIVVEGDPADRKFVAVYGRGGRTVAALAFNRPSRIMAYRAMIAAGASFPP